MMNAGRRRRVAQRERGRGTAAAALPLAPERERAERSEGGMSVLARARPLEGTPAGAAGCPRMERAQRATAHAPDNLRSELDDEPGCAEHAQMRRRAVDAWRGAEEAGRPNGGRGGEAEVHRRD